MIELADFITATQVEDSEGNSRIGEIVDFFSDGAPKVKFAGESSASEKEYPYLKSYIPSVGDYVLLLRVSGSFVILGAINFQVAPDQSLATLQAAFNQYKTATNLEIQNIKTKNNTQDADITALKTKVNTNIPNQFQEVNTELTKKITSDMVDDVGGNFNIDYMYVDGNGKLCVRRKNGVWTIYHKDA